MTKSNVSTEAMFIDFQDRCLFQNIFGPGILTIRIHSVASGDSLQT